MQHGIDVTAIHNHGLMDMPRLFYMHFWANDDPLKLCAGLRGCLESDQQREALKGSATERDVAP